MPDDIIRPENKVAEQTTQKNQPAEGLQPMRPAVIIAAQQVSEKRELGTLPYLLEDVSTAEANRRIELLIKLAQETDPALYERKTDRHLRQWGGMGAFSMGVLAIIGISLLGYRGAAPLPILLALAGLATAALGVGGAIVTAQRVTVKDVLQSASELLGATRKTDKEDIES